MKLIDEVYHFVAHFDAQSGAYIRTSILDQNGRDTHIDPFMASFPHLLDIGIMGHCEHGLSGRCQQLNHMCYQNGSTHHQAHMTLQAYKKLIDEASTKVFQVALGGRGDPDCHPDFESILAYTRKKNIVPNLTTSGYLLTTEKAKLMAKYCGAVAVSWYRSPYTYKAIRTLLEVGVRTNIHFVLTPETIDEAIELLEYKMIPEGINRVIFLLLKPIGEANSHQVLTLDSKTKKLLSLFETDYGLKKVGFDSCTVPGILQHAKRIDPRALDACEAGRFSAYITPDLRLLPCSFDQQNTYGIEIQSRSIQDGWNSSEFNSFRKCLKETCIDCHLWTSCMGGCPLTPEITLCEAKQTGGVL